LRARTTPKQEIRAAVGYLLRGATGRARGDIVQEIIAIVRQVASGLPPEQSKPAWTMICRAADRVPGERTATTPI